MPMEPRQATHRRECYIRLRPMRTLIVLVLLCLTSSLAYAEESPFASWARRVAGAEKLRVRRVLSGQLDADASIESAAELCDPSGSTRGFWLIEKDASHRWALAFDSGQTIECSGEVASSEKLQGSLPIVERADAVVIRERVALRDGALVLLSSEVDSAERSRQVVSRDDWEKLAFHRASADETPVGVVLAMARQSEPQTPNFTVFGKERWTGRDDASLQVTATAQPLGALRVTLRTTDDVVTSVEDGASEKRFLAADHWELWWTEEDPGCTPKPNRLCGVRQLGIALKEDGRFDVRWLYPFNYREPLPRVSGTHDSIEVVLPKSMLPTSTVLGSRGRFTAVFSDSDTPGGEQETLVATSQLKWGKPESFGFLLGWPGRRTFPPPSAGRLISDCWSVGGGERFR